MGDLIAIMVEALMKALPLQIRLRLVACSAFILTILAYLLFLGYLPSVFPGFARSDALRSIQKNIAEDSILQLRIEQCKMPSGSGKAQYAKAIAKRQMDYQGITGQQVELPACGDL
jgi:hypothetical protein